MQPAPVPPLLVLCLVFSNKKSVTKGSKYFKRWYRGRLRQTMAGSWYCLGRFVPEGMSQVSRRLEVGNHKRRTLSTWLSSGTSAGTFACPAGPYRNCKGEAGTKNEPNGYFVPDPKKGPKIDPHVSKDLMNFFFRSTLNMVVEKNKSLKWTKYILRIGSGNLPDPQWLFTKFTISASIVRCGLSCLVGLNSDLYRLCGSLHGLDTF